MEKWSLRELYQAVEFKRREQWSNWSYALHWIVNSMPSFAKGPRKTIRPEHIDPYRQAQVTGGIALTRDSPEAEAALDAWAERGKANR